MSTPDVLTRPDGRSIAFRRTAGTVAGPGVVFLSGFMSSMDGEKALALEAHCRARGAAFLRFDHAGQGATGGDIAVQTVGGWADDAVAVLDELTDGPQVLVGSSLGGWLMMLVARARPERVAGLLGVAAAPDVFAERYDTLDPEVRQRLEHDGLLRRPSAYDPAGYVYGRALLETASAHRVLAAPFPFTGPVRLLHGRRDPDVPWSTSERLAAVVTSNDVALEIVEDGDHRLSRPQDLERLLRLLDEVRAAA